MQEVDYAEDLPEVPKLFGRVRPVPKTRTVSEQTVRLGQCRRSALAGRGLLSKHAQILPVIRLYRPNYGLSACFVGSGQPGGNTKPLVLIRAKSRLSPVTRAESPTYSGLVQPNCRILSVIEPMSFNALRIDPPLCSRF